MTTFNEEVVQNVSLRLPGEYQVPRQGDAQWDGKHAGDGGMSHCSPIRQCSYLEAIEYEEAVVLANEMKRDAAQTAE